MQIEIVVRARENAYSFPSLAEDTLTFESKHPATVQIGTAVQDMVCDVVRDARAKLAEAAQAEAEGEGQT